MEAYCIHGRIGWCSYCESEMEGIEHSMAKINRRADIDQFEREKFKADIEFSKKPYWVQMAEEGDYLADGSDLQGYDYEED